MNTKICCFLLVLISSHSVCQLPTCFLSPLLAQEPSTEEKTPGKSQTKIPNSIKELDIQQRRELSFALSKYFTSERGYAEKVINRYAPIDRPGIFEAHEALVNFAIHKKNNPHRQPNTAPYEPDFEFLKKHLEHMRNLKPDSSVIELTEQINAYQTYYQNAIGRRKSQQVAFDAWNANPLEYKHVLYFYETISKQELPEIYRAKIESQLDEAVEQALLEEKIEVARSHPSLPVIYEPSPKRKQLITAVMDFFEKYDVEKGIEQLEQLSKHPNYSSACQAPLNKLGLLKMQALAMKTGAKNSKATELPKGDLGKKPKGAAVAANNYNDTNQPADRQAQLAYLRTVIVKDDKNGRLKRIPSGHWKAFELLVDIIFEGGEHAEQAKQIYDPTVFTKRSEILGVRGVRREYIAQKFYDAGNYDKVLMWADRGFGTQFETLAIWCIANVKSEKGDPKIAFEHIKHHQMDNAFRPRNRTGYSPDLVKAKGMLLVENGYPLLAVDLLKLYLIDFPDDQDAKDYLAKCKKQIQAEVR